MQMGKVWTVVVVVVVVVVVFRSLTPYLITKIAFYLKVSKVVPDNNFVIQKSKHHN